MKTNLLSSVVLLLLVLAAAPGAAHAQAVDVRVTIDALVAGENGHQVDAVLALFTDNATVQLVTGNLAGKGQIRAWQQDLAAGNFHVTAGPPVINGNHATWFGSVALDRFRALGLASLDGTWDLIFQGAKIRSFTFTFTPTALARLQAATVAATPGMPRTGAPGPRGLWPVLLTALGLLGLGSRLHARGARPSESRRQK